MKTINQKSILLKIAFALFSIMLTFTACTDDDNFSDAVPDYAEAIIRSFKAVDKLATINHTSATIALTLPAGADLSSINVEIVVPESANVIPASGSNLDFSNGPITFEVVAANGANRTYTASVGAFGDPKMLTFAVGDNQGVINDEDGTITMEIGSQDGDITALAPVFNINEGTTVDVASGIARDFTNPVVYSVLSNDGFTGKQYTVSITQIAAPLISSFNSSADICSVNGIIDNENLDVTLNFPAGTDLSTVTPVIEVSEGSTISPESGVLQDFSAGPIDYVVTNSEMLTATYTVTANSIASTKRVAFISGADCVQSITEADTKAAGVWLQNNYANDFVYLQASTLTAADLVDTDVVYFYWDNVDTTDMPDGGITSDKVTIITDYYKNGGHLIVSGFAINHLDDIGRINISGTIFTNEGGNTGLANQNGDAWGMRGSYTLPSPAESANHPVLANLDFDNGGTYYAMNDAGFKEDRNMGIDFGWPEYNVLFTQDHCSEDRALEFEAATNSVLIRWFEWLDARGCGIGVAEFKPQGVYNGTMILNTGGWLEWSMDDNNGAVNNFQNNIYTFHSNAIDYLLNL